MQRANTRLSKLASHLDNTFRPSPQFSLQLEDCCGIIAYVGTDSALPYLTEGIKTLQNRGYDSAGICTVDSSSSRLVTTKFASVGTTSDAIDRLVGSAVVHDGHSCGIAHTRWATHGAKIDINAHPHSDQSNRFAIVHNGVIENSDSLKQELVAKGVKFISETDSEVIAQLIGYYAKEGLSSVDAVQKTLGRMEGTWGLVIIDKEAPNQLIAAKNGSPILIGVAVGRTFVASEPLAFSQHTKEFISLENGEFAVLTNNGHTLDQARIQLAPPAEPISHTPEPYPHWTLKEIIEQPAAISRSLNYGGRIQDDSTVKLGGLEEKTPQLKDIKHLVISACGTSYFASLFGALVMRYLNSFQTVQVVDSSELTMDTLPRKAGGFLVISQSGETKDVARSLEIAEALGLPSFSIVNAVRSLIARTTRCGVYLNAGREVAVASTKAFTCQVSVLTLVAIWFSQQKDGDPHRRKLLIDSLHRLPTNIGMTINKLRVVCKTIAVKLNPSNHLFILGKGFAEPIAREGALKIKEISYLHAEGYPGGALKHGPFALIEKGTPIILIILSDPNSSLMKTVAAEVKARDAYTIVITDIPNLQLSSADEIIQIPNNGILTAILAVIPLQLIAYELAILRGINPDVPRNLAKTVTVD